MSDIENENGRLGEILHAAHIKATIAEDLVLYRLECGVTFKDLAHLALRHVVLLASAASDYYVNERNRVNG